MTVLENQKNIVGRAIAIAAQVHQHQVDKGGEPYILHCLEVGRRAGERYDLIGIAGDWPWKRDAVIAAAVLHDALEDFEGEPLELRVLRDRIYNEFPSLVYEAVDALTKFRGDRYDEYIERVSRHWLARLVKLCDLSHNMDAWRIPSGKITERDFERWDRYHRSFVRLMRED